MLLAQGALHPTPPLQLVADVCKLCKNQPDKYGLLLIDGDDNPLETTGKRLRAICDIGALTLYPVKCRLAYHYEAPE